MQRKIRNILGCQSANLLDTYLGLPLTTKEVTNDLWNTIVERIQKKLAGWKGKILINASKLQYSLQLFKEFQSTFYLFLKLTKTWET